MMRLNELWRRHQLTIDLDHTFSTESGRRAWDYILEICHVNQPSFHPNQSSEATAFREGERNIALRLMAVRKYRELEDAPRKAVTEEEPDA